MSSRSETVARKPMRPAAERAAAATRAGDPSVLLMAASGVLVMLGLIMILSASSVSSFATYGSSFLFFNKQLVWAVVGLSAFAFFARLDYHRLKGSGYALYLICALLLTAVLIPGIGVMVGGSARWLRFGPISFQPSELAKLAVILFAADVFARRTETSFKELAHTVLPMVPAVGILVALVMLQPDLGTTLLLGAISGGMLFVAGAPMRHLLPLGAAGAGLAVIAALAAPYRRARVLAFLNPWSDPLNTGYQTIQSLIALGSGGWFGVGLGASRQKWSYVPNAHTDFIFAILGEEMGLLGTITVLGLFGLLAYLGISTARRAPDRYGMLLAAGITVWISVQAIVNIGAVTATMPITGVPLPLVSFGGSSLVVCLIGMGVLTNICRQGRARTTRRVASARTPRTRSSPGR